MQRNRLKGGREMVMGKGGSDERRDIETDEKERYMRGRASGERDGGE